MAPAGIIRPRNIKLDLLLEGYFGDWKPASTTVCVNCLSTPGARVELDMIAVKPK